jgi:hypothetical protein
MRAVEGDLLPGQQRPQDPDRLGQARDPDGCRVERDACLLVLGPQVAGADAQLEAPVAQQPERGGLPTQQDRMPQVVVGHQGADMQPLGGLGRRSGRDQRREGVVKVIGEQQRVEPQGLDPVGLRPPGGA